MDPGEDQDYQTDLTGRSEKMPSFAVSAGEKGETGSSAPEALRVSVVSCFFIIDFIHVDVIVFVICPLCLIENEHFFFLTVKQLLFI